MNDKLAGDPSYEAGRAAHAEVTRTPNTGSPSLPTLSDEGSRQSGVSARKPHRDFAGYVAELRNKYSGGHTVISDCKRAAAEGTPLVENYIEEGGRYQVLCNEHGHLVYCTNLPAARECMKDPTEFCMVCRSIAGEGPENWENELAPHDVAAVWLRRGAYLSKA